MFKAILILIALNLNASFYDEVSKPAVQDCKVICDKCGFYIRQTKDYLEKLKTSYKEEDTYYVAMDDLINYLYNAKEYLYANGIEANFYSPPAERCPILTFDEDSLEVSKIDNPFYLYPLSKRQETLCDSRYCNVRM